VDQIGQNIVSSSTDRVYVPTFEISSHPQVPLRSLRERGYSIFERAQDRAVADITAIESRNSLNILGAASTGCDRIIRASEFDSLESIQSTLRNAFISIESNDLSVTNIFMSPADYATIRRFLRSLLDETTHGDLSRGIFASLWGAQINVSRHLSLLNGIYLTAEPQFVGGMPIQTDITALSADDPEHHSIGWSIYETIGMCCYNPRGIVRITQPAAVEPEDEIDEEIVLQEGALPDNLFPLHSGLTGIQI
jgi:hypothetical protein